MSLSPSVKLSKHILQSFDVVVVVMSSSMMCSVLIKTSSCKWLIASCERPGGLLLGAGTNRILSASTRDILCDRLVKISGLTSDASARVFLMNKLIQLAILQSWDIFQLSTYKWPTSNNFQVQFAIQKYSFSRMLKSRTEIVETSWVYWNRILFSEYTVQPTPNQQRKSYK